MSWSIKPIELTHTRDVLEYEPIDLTHTRDVLEYEPIELKQIVMS